MLCTECNKEITLLYEDGWPTYYYDAPPKNPEEAVAFFCDCICSTKYHERENDRTRTNPD